MDSDCRFTLFQRADFDDHHLVFSFNNESIWNNSPTVIVKSRFLEACELRLDRPSRAKIWKFSNGKTEYAKSEQIRTQ